MSLATGDMEAYCHYKYSFCDEPGVIQIDEGKYFTPKPESKSVAPEPSGEVINVLHLSDWHLDPRDFATPYSLSNSTNDDNFSWNYQLLASLWGEMGWIDNTTARSASTHYGAYAYVTPQGLKIISINTDFWYTANPFNYYNFTNPDQSGILRFLIRELEASEAADQRAWIIGHVPSGYGGTGVNGKALHNPSALFYSIVRRFSPATIAGIFWGHLHQDQLMVYYDYNLSSGGGSGGSLRNTTDVDYARPLAWAHMAPSVTPLTGLNAGWTLYQVDARTFEVTNWQTFIANVSEANAWTEPVWQFEYDARAEYDGEGRWPRGAPLNATFWHGVTERMVEDGSLVEKYNLFETKSSVVTKNCSSKACAEQKVCYIRSGSTMLGDLCSHGNGPF
ncbi:Ser thr protein phosphatase family protein [Lasiodiplodia theobromae]|uniref:Ser thr protein phosphatase family protein n=1 Tax=Lasiodiplodia theobromae TaxID=45133 RepID=UPI0015C38E3C|nr:Ser thr protein phosphatase family protein [Lasiodiplodia theobromae]KAF4540609.1 Ser thr protein phosphatase family protein [Lasiodiplodia theobromae]